MSLIFFLNFDIESLRDDELFDFVGHPICPIMPLMFLLDFVMFCCAFFVRVYLILLILELYFSEFLITFAGP